MCSETPSKAAKILTAMLKAAEEQLKAATSLDATGLDAATERRVSLLGDLEEVGLRTVDEVTEVFSKLKRIDSRLTRVLSSGRAVFDRAVDAPTAATYDRGGRIRGASR